MSKLSQGEEKEICGHHVALTLAALLAAALAHVALAPRLTNRRNVVRA